MKFTGLLAVGTPRETRAVPVAGRVYYGKAEADFY